MTFRRAVPADRRDESDLRSAGGSDKKRFRWDLRVTREAVGPGRSVYVVEDPRSGERFEFDEETFFLCQALDGQSTSREITARFRRFFGRPISAENLQALERQLSELGLLEGADESADVDSTEFSVADSPGTDLATPDSRDAGDDNVTDASRGNQYRWPLFNPERVFKFLCTLTRPFRLLFLLLVFGLVPGVPLALLTLAENEHLLRRDLASLVEPNSYLGRLVLTLFLMNLARCLVQGIVCTHFGGVVRQFGIRLRFGIIPRFYIDKSAIRGFDRHSKLWSYGSNMLMRLLIMVLGVFVWHTFRSTGTELAVWAILLAHSALISFLVVILPVRTADGYKWWITLFGLPNNLLRLSLQVLGRTIMRRPMPSGISGRRRFRLTAYALILVSVWSIAFVLITSHIAQGLVGTFPDLFGEATEILFLCLVIGIVIRWAWWKFSPMRGDLREPGTKGGTALSRSDTQIRTWHAGSHSAMAGLEFEEEGNYRRRWLARLPMIAALAIIAIVLLLPFPYRPGGEIVLLPPLQQNLQTPVSGKIAEVFFNGGDGLLIQAGTVVARIVAADIENEIATLNEQITRQRAELDKRRADLAKLLTGARPEEVEQSRARVAEAQAQVELAERQLLTAKVTAEYSRRELEQLEGFAGVAIAMLEVERSRKQAEIDRLTVEERRMSLTARKKYSEQMQAGLALLLSGVRSEDIEAARQEVNSAAAELRRLQQELRYAGDRRQGTELIMPFDGYLVNGQLKQRVGSYLNQGDNFSVVQNDHRLLVQVDLPEYEAGEVHRGAEAEIKLLAYPDVPLHGRVVAVEPVSSEAAYGEVFKILIEAEHQNIPLKPGMTGYGKIYVGHKPLYALLVRPIVRFARIEVWSWLP